MNGRRLFSLAEIAETVSTERRLPWMPKAEDLEEERHLGGMIRRLWQGHEQQQLYILELQSRIAELEKRLK